MAHPLTVPMQDPFAIPASWYTVGASRDLQRGGLLAATIAGIDLVIYRTEDGHLSCVEDRCPHLGGRFSAGGQVRGDELICPVHRFRFAPDGHCRGSGYGTAAPKACTRPWHCLDRNGLLLVYYHPEGAAPTWEPPLLNVEGWRRMRLFTRRVAAPAEIVMQGIADMGHLGTLHGYEDVRMDSDFRTHGTRLTVTYSFTNVGTLPGLGGPLKRLGQYLQTRTRVSFEYLACGIGYSVTDVEIPALGVVMRHFVNPTPIDAHNVTLYHSMALRRIERPEKISRVFALLPRSWAEAVMGLVLLKGFKHDIEDDINLWEQQRNPQKPALARGDGPVHKYRKWASQFYPAAAG